MASPNSSIHSRRRVIKACTACKQSKVRCDADSRHGQACTRCRTRGLECEVDAHFKRTPVRERMKSMAAELKQLRQTVRDGAISPEQKRADLLAGTDTDMNDNGFEYPSPDSSLYQKTVAEHPFGLGKLEGQDMGVEPTSLGPITFSVDEICECFRVYAEHFHPFLPLLTLSTPVGDLQRSSPFLFKTVIVIVCQRYHPLQRSGRDFRLLAEVYQALLNQSILATPLSLHSIQAILLICTWPLPSAYQLSEPSWLYCGVAANAASYLNLGRLTTKPFYQGGQLSQMDMENMSRTWIALFLISTSIATFLGVPLPFRHSSDINGIEARIFRKEVPRPIAAHASITVVVARHSGILCADTDLTTHDALVRMHVEELDRIPQRFTDIWNDNLEFFCQSGKVHLYISLLIRSHRPTGVYGDVDLNKATPPGDILVPATSCACLVISLYDRIVGSDESLYPDTTMTCSAMASILPKAYFRRMSHAAFFLLRFVCFSKACQETTRENAREHLLLAAAALQRTSRCAQPKDEAARGAATLRRLLEHGDMLQEQRLQIDDRGGASIFWDTLHRSLQLKGASTARTDLMELIDPTRTIKLSGRDSEAFGNHQMPTPGAVAAPVSGDSNAQPSEDAIVFEDSLMEFFDLNMFDIGDFGP